MSVQALPAEIRRLRGELTQHELALGAGVSLDTVRRAERGGRIELDSARAIAAALRVDYRIITTTGGSLRARIPEVMIADVSNCIDAHSSLEQQQQAAHRKVDEALAGIGLFLHRDLAASLSGHDGTLEPNRDWHALLDRAATIRSSYPSLTRDQELILERMLLALENNLNRLLSFLRDTISRGLGRNKAEQPVVRQMDTLIAVSVEHFETSYRLYRTTQKKLNDESSQKGG